MSEGSEDSAVRNRLKLWLRSERAMGLSAVPVVLAVRGVAPAPLPADRGAGLASDREDGLEVQVAASAQVSAPVQGAVRPQISTRGGLGGGGGGGPFQRNSVTVVASGVLNMFDGTAFTGPVVSTEEKRQLLKELDDAQVKGCVKCRLCEQRTQTVFGEGDVDAALMFVGEGPGEDEDRQGRPFVGRAGRKLEEMIVAMGLQRGGVFIGNVVKCRPPGNRQPAPDEMDACIGYLVRQIEVIRPRVLVALGLTATRALLRKNETMSRMRGCWHEFRGIKLMPTFHPSYILRNYTPETRTMVWSDLQQVMAELGIKKAAK